MEEKKKEGKEREKEIEIIRQREIFGHVKYFTCGGNQVRNHWLQRVDLYSGRLLKSNLICAHLSASAPFPKCQSYGEIWLYTRRKILVGKKRKLLLNIVLSIHIHFHLA